MSDHQFRSFRDGIPSLVALFTLFIVINRKFGDNGRCYGTLLFVFALHGFKFFEPAVLVLINYAVLKSVRSQVIVPFTWIYTIGTLFLLESRLVHSLDFWIWNGFLPHWSVVFKVSILRMVSFNLDYHKSQHITSISDCCDSSGELCHKCRVRKCSDDFSLKEYFKYVFYPPLYLSGPIMTFNDFSHQNKHKKKNSFRSNFIYGIRLLASIVVLEVVLHLFHVCAIKSASAWHQNFSPLAFASVAFFNLKIIWLKLLVIWRFARFFALCDGIDPPENMIRCMSNNYSTLMFWRSWHRSFNLWILRYLYIPLGGRATSNWNIFPIFAFVAIWHDVNWQLMAWGCLIPVFILPEILANWTAKKLRMSHWRNYREICALAAALNIFLLMIGNLVGFSVGVTGAKLMITKIFGNGGFLFILSVLVTFYAAVQLMFEIREEEFRRSGKYPVM